MDEINKEILKTFGHQLRVRVSGLCVVNKKVLLVCHQGIGTSGKLWSPPGGGMQFGETAPQTLQREFGEETGLNVTVGRFLCVNEFVGLPLHAIELFFEVHLHSGKLSVGTEPEIVQSIIKEVRWMDFEEIKHQPTAQVHSLFQHCNTVDNLLQLQGYFYHQS
jgi:8-oxo-dGTP diphosphatase